jgi:putative membrane protein
MDDATESTRLAVERTRLAYERTLMAWVRTAISLITFGFSIYKFFQIEREVFHQPSHLIGATEFAALMVGIGLLSLLMATVDHRRNLNALKTQYPDIPRSLAQVFAALISVLGVLALAAIVLRR